MKVVAHTANEHETLVLVEMDQYDLEALTNRRTYRQAMMATTDGPGPTIINGVRHWPEGKQPTPPDWRPPVGTTLHPRMDLSDVIGCLRANLAELEALQGIMAPPPAEPEPVDPILAPSGPLRLRVQKAVRATKPAKQAPPATILRYCIDLVMRFKRATRRANYLASENVRLRAEINKLTNKSR